MKWKGLHCLVVHPASLEVRRKEERGEGGRKKGRKVNHRKCIGACAKITYLSHTTQL